MAVGDGGDPRPHVSAEEVHVLFVPGFVAPHDRTEAVSNITIVKLSVPLL